MVLLIFTIGTLLLPANPILPLWPYLECTAFAGLVGSNSASAMTNINAFSAATHWLGTDSQHQRRQPRDAGYLGPGGPVGDRDGGQPTALLGVYRISGDAGSQHNQHGERHGQFTQYCIAVNTSLAVLSEPYIWLIALLHIVTFVFVGFSFAFGPVLQIHALPTVKARRRLHCIRTKSFSVTTLGLTIPRLRQPYH